MASGRVRWADGPATATRRQVRGLSVPMCRVICGVVAHCVLAVRGLWFLDLTALIDLISWTHTIAEQALPQMASRRQPKTPERGAATGDTLPVFVLDMEEQPETGSIALYGCTFDRRSVMLTVEGFSYYFTISADGGAITKAGLRSDVSANGWRWYALSLAKPLNRSRCNRHRSCTTSASDCRRR